MESRPEGREEDGLNEREGKMRAFSVRAFAEITACVAGGPA